MTIIFLVMHLNLKSFYNSSIIVFLSFIWMNFIFENKFFLCVALLDVVFFLLFYSINLIRLYFYYRLLK